MRALSHWAQVSPQDHAAALELLEKAVAIDPEYCQALGVQSAMYCFGAHMGWGDASVVVPLAEQAAQAAVRIDGEDAWAHHALGGVHLIRRRFDDALAATEHALQLNPSFSHAQNYYAAALGFSGRWEEATEAAKRALRLSPRDPFLALIYGSASFAYYIGGEYEEAIRTAQTAVRLRPDFSSACRVLVAAAGMTGRKELATAALAQLRRIHPNISRAWIKNHVPLKLDTDLVHYLDGFRRAGLA